MYIKMHECKVKCTYIKTHLKKYIFIGVFLNTCIFIYVYFLHMCILLYIYVFLHIYILLYIYMFLYIYISLYIHIFLYIYILLHIYAFIDAMLMYIYRYIFQLVSSLCIMEKFK